MPAIYIKRDSEWANKLRNFELYLNGIKLGEIGDRQTKKFVVPPGTYKLEAKIDWCGSKPLTFTLGREESIHVQVSGFVMSKYFMPSAMLIALLYFFLYLKYNYNSLILGVILMGFLGYLIFFLSFGRNYYLRLELK